jgi:hypothetical protein
MTNKTWQVLYIMTMAVIATAGCLCVASCAPLPGTSVPIRATFDSDRQPLHAQYYHKEAKIWVFPAYGLDLPEDVEEIELQFLAPGKGWRAAVDYGVAVWHKGQEIWVPDPRDKLRVAGCVYWRLRSVNVTYGRSR